MDKKWHAVSLFCPDCGTKLVKEEIFVSGDREMMLHLKCVKCNTMLGWVSDLAKMMLVANNADIEGEVASPTSRPLTDYEKKWERQMGISWQKGG